jgi:beta-phosphoglucomutase-like phosphatase (HAD superfamily)
VYGATVYTLKYARVLSRAPAIVPELIDTAETLARAYLDLCGLYETHDAETVEFGRMLRNTGQAVERLRKERDTARAEVERLTQRWHDHSNELALRAVNLKKENDRLRGALGMDTSAPVHDLLVRLSKAVTHLLMAKAVRAALGGEGES